MLNVLVTRPFAEEQLQTIAGASPEIMVRREPPAGADYADAEVIYGNDLPDLAAAPKLRWVQLHGAGINTIVDHPVYTQSQIDITTASGVHSMSAADYVLATLQALAHRVPQMLTWQAKGSWPPDEQRWPIFLPAALRGASIGIIGYGSIGREVARLAKAAFGMRVLACKRDISRKADDGYSPPGIGDPDGSLPDEWYETSQLLELLARSDVVVMSAPLTPQTHRLLGEREIAAMRPDAYFINVGRGATVDQSALTRALAERRIAGAALDVFEEEPLPAGDPLYALDNVILSPHVSGFIPGYDDLCARLFAENLRRYLAGQPLFNLVDRAKGY